MRAPLTKYKQAGIKTLTTDDTNSPRTSAVNSCCNGEFSSVTVHMYHYRDFLLWSEYELVSSDWFLCDPILSIFLVLVLFFVGSHFAVSEDCLAGDFHWVAEKHMTWFIGWRLLLGLGGRTWITPQAASPLHDELLFMFLGTKLDLSVPSLVVSSDEDTTGRNFLLCLLTVVGDSPCYLRFPGLVSIGPMSLMIIDFCNSRKIRAFLKN